jgi:hypothetical protein
MVPRHQLGGVIGPVVHLSAADTVNRSRCAGENETSHPLATFEWMTMWKRLTRSVCGRYE